MNGMVTGGWSYVWSAYAVTAALLFGYAVKTIVALREHRRR